GAVVAMLDSAIKWHNHGFGCSANLPGRTVGEPIVRLFFLMAADDLLAEEPVLVVDAIAKTGQTHRRQRVEKASCQPAKAAVAQGGIRLALLQRALVHAKFSQSIATSLVDAEIGQVVPQGPAHEKLHGQVIDALGIGFLVTFLGLQHALDESIAD